MLLSLEVEEARTMYVRREDRLEISGGIGPVKLFASNLKSKSALEGVKAGSWPSRLFELK